MGFTLLGILNAQAAGAQAGQPPALNYEARYDAAALDSITASSGSVSQLNDLSGNDRHLSQATASLQPTTGTTVNDLNAISFAQDSLVASTASDWTFMSNGETYFVATAMQQSASGGINVFTATASATVGFILNQTGDLDDGLYNRVYNGEGFPSAPLVVDMFPQTFATTATAVYSVLNDPDNGTASARGDFKFNNDLLFATNVRTNSVNTATPSFPLSIGQLIPTYATGVFCELLIVKGAEATNSNRNLVIDYLIQKWGVV